MCEMLPGFILYILPILFIASVSSSLEFYDDTSEESEAKTTLAPILLSLPNLQPKEKRMKRLYHYLLNKLGKKKEDILEGRHIRHYMKDLKYKVKYLEKLYAKNEDKMADGHVSQVVEYVNQSYRNLAAEYKNFEQHPWSTHPVKLMRAYDKVRMTNLAATYLLKIFSGDQLFDKNGLPPWADKSGDMKPLGLAWNYYDDSLG